MGNDHYYTGQEVYSSDLTISLVTMVKSIWEYLPLFVRKVGRPEFKIIKLLPVTQLSKILPVPHNSHCPKYYDVYWHP